MTLYVEFWYLLSVALSVRQSTELFHLVFLRALVAKGEDKSLVALKGGCKPALLLRSVMARGGSKTGSIRCVCLST
jgi:hypothetical protein